MARSHCIRGIQRRPLGSGLRASQNPLRVMYTFHRPTDEQLRHHRLELAHEECAYPGVGRTRDWPRPAFEPGTRRDLSATVEGPDGYVFGGASAALGHGEEDFARAVEALEEWSMFPAQRAVLEERTVPIATGETVALGLRGPGFWVLCGCRIVYTLDERSGPRRCFGFAYGTLSTHVERGEERFLVGHDEDTGAVWYEIASFSRSQGWLCALGQPLVRHLQATFRRDSVRAMRSTFPPTAGL